MSHNYADNGDSQSSSSSADPSGGLSKIGFYCLISCRAKIDSEWILLRHNLWLISGFKNYFLGRVKGSNLGSKFNRSQISPFKVRDIFSLFHYPLCHSNNQEINRKSKILLQFLPSGNVIRNTWYDVTMASSRTSELGLCSWKILKLEKNLELLDLSNYTSNNPFTQN